MSLQQLSEDHLFNKNIVLGNCEQAVRLDPSLVIVSGRYIEDGTIYEHTWCKRPDGSVYDPSSYQFESGGLGNYQEIRPQEIQSQPFYPQMNPLHCQNKDCHRKLTNDEFKVLADDDGGLFIFCLRCSDLPWPMSEAEYYGCDDEPIGANGFNNGCEICGEPKFKCPHL